MPTTSTKNRKKPYNNRKEKNLTQATSQTDIYALVTNKILSDLEKGNLTWRKPWNSDHLAGQVMLPLRWNNIPYSGINTIMLWGTAAEKEYQLPHWMTFDQAIKLKANVRKGEKGTQVVYADKLVKEEEKDGETKISKIPYLKCYTVFNASQIDGLPDAFYHLPEPKTASSVQRNAELEYFFAQTKAEIYTGNQASYNQTNDKIQMPPFESFESFVAYYATLGHEITHWTKHPKRLDRDFGRKRYGDEGYAKEELVAELGACFLAANLGFEPIPEEQHAAYIQSWMKELQNDRRFIFSAAAHAQRAVEYIQSCQKVEHCIPS
jgi:antirestriction protein ArdC